MTSDRAYVDRIELLASDPQSWVVHHSESGDHLIHESGVGFGPIAWSQRGIGLPRPAGFGWWQMRRLRRILQGLWQAMQRNEVQRRIKEWSEAP